jgi:lycopene beta-cyclase
VMHPGDSRLEGGAGVKKVEFAILGGGASGLSLALALGRSSLRERSILIVEKESKDANDRTWCWWTDQETPYDGIRHAAWGDVRFVSEGIDKEIPLRPYRYQMLRGIDFYRTARQALDELPNVEMVQAAVDQVWEVDGGVRFRAGEQEVQAEWVFDSRFLPGKLPLDTGGCLTLWQHFEGWTVETEQPTFDPCTATLFDLRTEQRGGLCFYYVLPFNERQALVEYTVFSGELWADEEYSAALQAYLDQRLGQENFQVLHKESGVIPMTECRFPRRLGKRWLAIGTRGGRVKPSSGYAFARIQADSEAIVRSLVKHGHPFGLPGDSPRRRFYDALLLEILAHEPQHAKPAFEAMFTRNPVGRIFRFLDEKSSLLEDFLLISSLPPQPFLRALRRWLPRRLRRSSPAG